MFAFPDCVRETPLYLFKATSGQEVGQLNQSDCLNALVRMWELSAVVCIQPSVTLCVPLQYKSSFNLPTDAWIPVDVVDLV